MSLRVSDWIGLNCGDVVRATDCPYEYLYRIEAIHSGGASVKCRALDYPEGLKIFAYFNLTAGDKLVVVRRAEAPAPTRMLRERPSTVVKSPRRQLEEELAGQGFDPVRNALANAHHFTCTMQQERRYVTTRHETLAEARAFRPVMEAGVGNGKKAMVYCVDRNGGTTFIPDSQS